MSGWIRGLDRKRLACRPSGARPLYNRGDISLFFLPMVDLEGRLKLSFIFASLVIFQIFHLPLRMEFRKYELVSAPTVLSHLIFANLITGSYKTERPETYFTYRINGIYRNLAHWINRLSTWPIAHICWGSNVFVASWRNLKKTQEHRIGENVESNPDFFFYHGDKISPHGSMVRYLMSTLLQINSGKTGPIGKSQGVILNSDSMKSFNSV